MITINEYRDRLKRFLSDLPLNNPQRVYSAVTNSANIQNFGLWASAVLAGLAAVGYAVLFRDIERAIHAFYAAHGAWWSFLVTPSFFFISWYLVKRFAPGAGGSGVPQIMAANEMKYSGEGRERIDDLLSMKTGAVKVLSSFFCVGGGGTIGPEGPTIQLSACIFHSIGRVVRRFVPETAEQTWVVAGAAAGLAAAFNTPLGGIVYAIEDLEIVHFHRMRTALISAVIIAGMVATGILGSYLYLGFPALAPFRFSIIPIAIFVGACSGGLGGLFGHLLFKMMEMRERFAGTRKMGVITILAGLIVAGLIAQDLRTVGSGADIMSNLLFSHSSSSLWLIFSRFCGTLFSCVSGAALGIFSPSLTLGATIGSFIAQIFHSDHGNLMTLLGMIGFMTGVMRTPFTCFILVVEMTDRHSAIFPMMIAALAAQSVAHLINRHSFYELMKPRYMLSAKPPTATEPIH